MSDDDKTSITNAVISGAIGGFIDGDYISTIGSTIALNKYILQQDSLKDYSGNLNPIYNGGLVYLINMAMGNDISIMNSVIQGAISQVVFDSIPLLKEAEKVAQDPAGEAEKELEEAEEEVEEEVKKEEKSIAQYFKTGTAYAKDHPIEFIKQHGAAIPEQIVGGPGAVFVGEYTGANKKIYDFTSSLFG